MDDNNVDGWEGARWDAAFTTAVISAVTPVVKRWFRAEVRGLEYFPPTGGALVVSNHSGGVLTPDWNVLATPAAKTPRRRSFSGSSAPAATRRTLANGLALLGIAAPEAM